MNKHQATNRDRVSRPLSPPIVLTLEEAALVGGGDGGRPCQGQSVCTTVNNVTTCRDSEGVCTRS